MTAHAMNSVQVGRTVQWIDWTLVTHDRTMKFRRKTIWVDLFSHRTRIKLTSRENAKYTVTFRRSTKVMLLNVCFVQKYISNIFSPVNQSLCTCDRCRAQTWKIRVSEANALPPKGKLKTQCLVLIMFILMHINSHALILCGGEKILTRKLSEQLRMRKGRNGKLRRKPGSENM